MGRLLMKHVLSLETAKLISKAAEEEADKMRIAVAIAVTDDKGDLIHFIRKDNTTYAAVDIAQKKALHAAMYRRDMLFHEQLLTENELLPVLSLPDSMPVEGGIQLIYKDTVVGAIGVSGSSSDKDGMVAKKGLEVFNKLMIE